MDSVFTRRHRAGEDVVAISCSGSGLGHLLTIQDKDRVPA